ncbi:MAG: fibrobacter succinogenes major paralogous domain-containing protein, partial [Candidatus Symbiothrix sp.]|nr:fibrobacter succinogenes major paralogous domain-containing protein [Candidatus Symbiothrix sp.]
DNQTGERIIVGTASPTTPWKVDVDDPSGSGNWLTLAVGRHNNATLYTPMPDNAENYPVTSGVTHIEAVGDIVFRIGATGINPQTDANYDTGKRPRYATVTLTVLTNPVKVYTLYCRQGESADYLFRNNDASDPLRGGTGSGAVRTASKRFSPYNLKGTVPSMTYWDTPIAGGEFVEYPTQAGSFWQWGTDLAGGGKTANLRYAYHPTSPVGAISGWDRDYNYHANNDTWHEFTGNNRLETCPPGWRRPMAGDTTSLHDNVAANAADSEVMQSLFYNTFDGSTLNVDNANYRYWGYYADGYFDRYPIDYGVGTPVSIRNAVEPRSEKVAYFGVIYTNPNTKASLFVPASGSRKTSSTYTNGSDDGFSGSLYASAGSYETNTGIEYYYWTSSAKDSYIAWMWAGGYSATNSADRIARQYGYGYRTSGVSVRCVRDE